jgi:DNA invertase Pin-like site-specific DNA recombinase
MSESLRFNVAVYCRIAREPEPKTALYCRTAQQSFLGIESQKERLYRFAEDNGYTNTSWYIDDGKIGSTLDRPAMQRLIADIEAGIIKTVIVTGADRIARGVGIMFEWLQFLEKNDVNCVSLENGGQDVGCEPAALNNLWRMLAQ